VFNRRPSSIFHVAGDLLLVSCRNAAGVFGGYQLNSWFSGCGHPAVGMDLVLKVVESIHAVEAKLKQLALRVLARAAAVSAFLVLVAAPHDAIARIGKCTMGSLTPAEESLLLATASRSLPVHAGLVVSNLCGSTSAEVTTQKIADRPGVRHWWVANCRRDSLGWVCDRIQFQEVEKRLIIRGMQRQVAMAFDEGTVPEAVESVATRALSIYADPGSQLPFCGGIQDPGNRWTALRKVHPLLEGKVRVHVTAQQYADSGSVLLDEVIQPDGIKIEIKLPIIGPDEQDLRPHKEAISGQKCGISGTSTVAVDCRAISRAIPIAVESPCWMAMAP